MVLKLQGGCNIMTDQEGTEVFTQAILVAGIDTNFVKAERQLQLTASKFETRQRFAQR